MATITRPKRRDRRRPSPNRPGGATQVQAVWYTIIRSSQTEMQITPIALDRPSTPGGTDAVVLFNVVGPIPLDTSSFLILGSAASYPVTSAVINALGNVEIECATCPAEAVALLCYGRNPTAAAAYGAPIAPAVIRFDAYP